MRTKPLLSLAGVALAVWLAVPQPSAAIGECSFNSVVGVNFGPYDVFNPSPTDSTGSITYTCISLLAPITIDLSKGSGSGYSPRRMHRGGDSLSYNLYLDASRVTVWGDGTGGSSRYGPVTPPLASPVTVTIYGRMPARQNARVGSYTDTIMVTI